MSKQTFAERCQIAEQCLPDAPYRAMLTKLHTEMLAALAEQSAREWVGLTDEEIEQGCKESWVTLQAWQSAVWWAEDKLKEKNT